MFINFRPLDLTSNFNTKKILLLKKYKNKYSDFRKNIFKTIYV